LTGNPLQENFSQRYGKFQMIISQRRKQPKTYTVIHFYKKSSSEPVQEKTIVLNQKGNQVHDEELIKDLEEAVSYSKEGSIWKWL
jgi:hypothetical protein